MPQDEHLQVARAATRTYRSHWKDASDTGAEDTPMAGSTGSRNSGGVKSGAGGYSTRRVSRFWSHYHGARPGAKEKSLEKQPRQDK